VKPAIMTRESAGVLDERDSHIKVKVAVIGRPASGKTAFINVLCGLDAASKYAPTWGIQVQQVEFPLKDTSENDCIRYMFWEVGGQQAAKYAHMEPSCCDQASLVMHVVSMTDRAGFEEMAARVQSAASARSTLIVATKQDNVAGWAIFPEELADLASTYKAKVLYVGNPPEISRDGVPQFVNETYDAIVSLLTLPKTR